MQGAGDMIRTLYLKWPDRFILRGFAQLEAGSRAATLDEIVARNRSSYEIERYRRQRASQLKGERKARYLAAIGET